VTDGEPIDTGVEGHLLHRFGMRRVDDPEVGPALEMPVEPLVANPHGGLHGGLMMTLLTFGTMHLAPLWGPFIDANPKVSLEITLSDRTVDLVEEGYDLAIRIATSPGWNIVSRKLASTRVVLCASPQYLKKHGTPKHPRDLADHALISYTYWSGGDEWTFSGPQGAVSVKVRSRIHANNGDTCRTAALAHQGIILQPDFLIGDDLRNGTLVELLPKFRSIELGIHAVYPTRKHLPLKLRRLIDFLVAAFRTPAWHS